jgi:hypothetical protein
MTALAVLDKLLNEEPNKEKLRVALQEMFDAAPAKFFLNVIIPLLPKDRNINVSSTESTPRTADQIVRLMDAVTTGTDPKYRDLPPGFHEHLGKPHNVPHKKPPAPPRESKDTRGKFAKQTRIRLQGA